MIKPENLEIASSPREAFHLLDWPRFGRIKTSSYELSLAELLGNSEYQTYKMASGELHFLVQSRQCVDQMLQQLGKRLVLREEDNGPQEAVFLYCPEVTVTYNVADELAHALAEPYTSAPYGLFRKPIVFVDPAEGFLEALDQAMWNIQHTGLVYDSAKGQLTYIGKLPVFLRNVIDRLIESDGITAAQLAERMDELKPKDISTRLKTLSNSGVLIRSVQEPFTYKYFHPRRSYSTELPESNKPYVLYQSKSTVYRSS